MRYSKQRELVLHTVEQLCDHPTAEEIFDKAAPECPGLITPCAGTATSTVQPAVA